MIALIAHDSKKKELLDFVLANRLIFSKYELVATESTGIQLREAGFDVQMVPHGPMGGDIVIASMVTQGEISAVFFFRDLLCSQPHDPDITSLLRICDLYNVPLATNIGTANYLIRGMSNAS